MADEPTQLPPPSRKMTDDQLGPGHYPLLLAGSLLSSRISVFGPATPVVVVSGSVRVAVIVASIVVGVVIGVMVRLTAACGTAVVSAVIAVALAVGAGAGHVVALSAGSG